VYDPIAVIPRAIRYEVTSNVILLIVGEAVHARRSSSSGRTSASSSISSGRREVAPELFDEVARTGSAHWRQHHLPVARRLRRTGGLRMGSPPFSRSPDRSPGQSIWQKSPTAQSTNTRTSVR